MFFGIGNRLRVSFISPGSLLVANLRSAAALDLLARISFCAVWYYILGRQPSSFSEWLDNVRTVISRDAVFLFALLFPLLAIPGMLRSIRVIIKGSRVFFDGVNRRILVNDSTVATFHDVASVRVTKIKGNRGSSYHELCVDLKGSRWIEMDQYGSSEEYRMVAGMIADVVHSKVMETQR